MKRPQLPLRTRVRWFGVLLVTTALLSAPVTRGEAPSGPAEWPQFLGPDRTGISDETGLLEKWPAGGPKEVWRVDGGVGASGMAIADNRLITLLQRDGQQWAVALDPKTGEQLWQTAIAPAFRNAMGDGPRATPTISGNQVFVLGGAGTLAALNLADGKIIWQRRPLEELGGKPAEYGMACSPLVAADWVIVSVGATQGTVVAYHRMTGDLVWKAGDDPAGYSSPALLQIHGEPQIVAFTGASLLGLEPKTGKLLWRYPYVTDYHCNIATPVALDNQVFISSGENHGSVLLSVNRTANDYAVAPVWESQGSKSVLRAEWQTPVLLEGHLYGFDNVGSAGPVTHLTCVKAATGERVWQQLRFGKGNLIAADGKLFISTMNGELVVVRASPAKFEELGRKAILGSTRQAPALAAGLLYLRDDEKIVCLDVRAAAAQSLRD